MVWIEASDGVQRVTEAEFLRRIERFLAASGLSASRFGRLAVGDPSLVTQLRKGRSPTGRTISRVVKFMEGW